MHLHNPPPPVRIPAPPPPPPPHDARAGGTGGGGAVRCPMGQRLGGWGAWAGPALASAFIGSWSENMAFFGSWCSGHLEEGRFGGFWGGERTSHDQRVLRGSGIAHGHLGGGGGCGIAVLWSGQTSAGSDMIGWSRVLLSHTLDAPRSY